MKQRLYVMVGCPGSGKSTWAKKTSAELNNNIKYVSRDEIRFEKISPEDTYFDKQKQVYNDFIWEIYTGLKNGQSVIADATHLNEKSRWKLLSKIIGTDAYYKDLEIVAVYIKTPLNICLERNETRRGTKTYVPPYSVRKMFYSLKEPNFMECKGLFNIIVTINENGKIISRKDKK